METTQVNFNVALAKGEIGEQIVWRWLEKHGFIIYKHHTEGAHLFDAIAIKNKADCIAIDVKSKARRNHFPDTGVDERLYAQYKQFQIQHSITFWVVFVDEMQGTIYGNSLDKLDAPITMGSDSYPLIEHGIRFWPLKNMVEIYKLNTAQVVNLKQQNQRNYQYKPER